MSVKSPLPAFPWSLIFILHDTHKEHYLLEFMVCNRLCSYTHYYNRATVHPNYYFRYE
jgi:hypothetical protein